MGIGQDFAKVQRLVVLPLVRLAVQPVARRAPAVARLIPGDERRSWPTLAESEIQLLRIY